MILTHTLADYFTMFWSNFFVVFLLGLQSKNVNAGRYVAAVITSFGISVANFIFVKYAAAGSYDVFAVCAIGGGFGIAFSIWFYQHFIEKKSDRRGFEKPQIAANQDDADAGESSGIGDLKTPIMPSVPTIAK